MLFLCTDLHLIMHTSCRWQNGQADLGHALVAFDIMANVLSHPRVDVAHFWTTRWRFGGFAPSNNEASAADALWVSSSFLDTLLNATSHSSLATSLCGRPSWHPHVSTCHVHCWQAGWEASDGAIVQDDNTLTATGTSLALLGKYFRVGTLLSVGSSQTVRTWAIKRSDASLVLALLNKALIVTDQDILLTKCSNLTEVRAAWMLSGTAYTDAKPTLTKVQHTMAHIANGVLSITLPAVSIVVLEF